jgi:hypothetical protein
MSGSTSNLSVDEQ